MVVLASSSSVRAAILANAGVEFEADAAAVDEAELKSALKAEGADAAAAAAELAELKARRIAGRHPGALVIGADQILECDGAWFDKPIDAGAARAELLALRGRAHELVAAVCVVRDGELLWRHTDRARLMVRSFSDAFLDGYLEAMGPAVLDTVGAYKLEGMGAQLFERIEGDYFTVLGLPLLPLLEFLRGHGVVPR